jgi:hypothetical protein
MTDQSTENKSTKDKSTEDELRPFAALLHDLDKGRTHTELSTTMRDLVAAVTETRKAGRIQLTIDVRPQSGTEDVVILTARVAAKVPAYDPPASIFYVDDQNNLTRNPTQQPSIFDLEGQTS